MGLLYYRKLVTYRRAAMIDIKGKTLEQVLREIAEALIAQGERCTSTVGCAYGNSKGQHCAIGFLLPEHSSTLMGFLGTVTCLIKLYMLDEYEELRDFIEENLDAMSALQNLHDGVTNYLRATRLETLQSLVGFDCSFFQPWVDMGEG
jgi:hypothetical protein